MDAWLLAAGLAAGMLSGLLGVGGGIILTPVFHYGLGKSWPAAVAMSLLVIAIQSPVGVYRHARKGLVDWRMAALLAGGGALGVAVGDPLVDRLPVAVLRLIFAAVMMGAAIQLTRKPPAARLQEMPVWALLLLGVAAGLLSRILGIGGGILTVPALAFAGITPHVAVATSLVPVFTNAAVASGANLARGMPIWAPLQVAAMAMIGAVLGAKIAQSSSPDGLRRVVAVGLGAVALLIAFRA